MKLRKRLMKIALAIEEGDMDEREQKEILSADTFYRGEMVGKNEMRSDILSLLSEGEV